MLKQHLKRSQEFENKRIKEFAHEHLWASFFHYIVAAAFIVIGSSSKFIIEWCFTYLFFTTIRIIYTWFVTKSIVKNFILYEKIYSILLFFSSIVLGISPFFCTNGDFLIILVIIITCLSLMNGFSISCYKSKISCYTYFFGLLITLGYSLYSLLPYPGNYFIIFGTFVYFLFSIKSINFRYQQYLYMEILLQEKQEMLKDLNEKIRLENELNEEREKNYTNTQSAYLGEMAVAMAHEINNPLTAVIGKLRILTRNIKNGKIDADLVIQFQDKANKNLLQISSLIHGLKGLAQKKDLLILEDLNINDVINESTEYFTDKFKEENINFNISIPKSIQIRGEKNGLSQVFFHLLKNSFEAIMEKNDRNKEFIDISACIDSKNLVIKIMDSGIGFKDKEKNKVLNPFFSTKEINKNTGLGLSISQRLVENNNGKLEIIRNCNPTTIQITFSLS